MGEGALNKGDRGRCRGAAARTLLAPSVRPTCIRINADPCKPAACA